jgi:hypothetical protein
MAPSARSCEAHARGSKGIRTQILPQSKATRSAGRRRAAHSYAAVHAVNGDEVTQPCHRKRMVFILDQTAIIIPVRAAEPIVGHWRKDFDPAAAAGVPAHITIIYPFLAQQDITEEVVGDLRRLIAHQPSFTVTFAQCGQFPDVLFLVPDPDDPFRRLTAELVQR